MYRVINIDNLDNVQLEKLLNSLDYDVICDSKAGLILKQREHQPFIYFPINKVEEVNYDYSN